MSSLFQEKPRGGRGSSACQRENHQCITCCGVFNLEYAFRPSLEQLLRERTRQYRATLAIPGKTAREYRLERERVEASYPRHREDVYVCPFAGFLEEESRMGCMIHPSRTGEADSQNASFYGSTLCLSYECPNLEQDRAGRYGELLTHLPLSGEEYSRSMADVRFFRSLQRAGVDFSEVTLSAGKRESFLALLRLRLTQGESLHCTSFESTGKEREDPCREVGECVGDPLRGTSLLDSLLSREPLLPEERNENKK